MSLFTDEVGLYETSNTGWPYDLGFVIGIFISMGWVVRIGARRWRWKRSQWSSIAEAVKNAMGEAVESLWREKSGWEDIPDRVEVRVRRVLGEWEQRHRIG